MRLTGITIKRLPFSEKQKRYWDAGLPGFGLTVGKQTKTVERDGHIRPGMTLEKLAKLPPVFRSKAEGGTVHAGNSSGINDGAAALLVCLFVLLISGWWHWHE